MLQPYQEAKHLRKQLYLHGGKICLVLKNQNSIEQIYKKAGTYTQNILQTSLKSNEIKSYS
jgi:hypothetical protein